MPASRDSGSLAFGGLCEQCNHLRVGLLLRQAHSRVAGLVPKLRIRAVHKQQFYDIRAPEHGCHHQSRLALVVARIYITVGGDQAMCDFG
jgi:hypothetical protein